MLKKDAVATTIIFNNNVTHVRIDFVYIQQCRNRIKLFQGAGFLTLLQRQCQTDGGVIRCFEVHKPFLGAVHGTIMGLFHLRIP